LKKNTKTLWFWSKVYEVLQHFYADSGVRRVEIKSRLTRTGVNYKVGAFADDVDFV
jgi:hypothetical protein